MRKKDLKFGCEFEFSSSWDDVKEVASAAIKKYMVIIIFMPRETGLDQPKTKSGI